MSHLGGSLKTFLPPAARGTLFVKTVPLDPLQKLFISRLLNFRVAPLYRISTANSRAGCWALVDVEPHSHSLR